MDTPEQVIEAPDATPVVEAPVAPTPEQVKADLDKRDAAPLSEHEKEFGGRDERGRFRHRAESQKAGPEDVPRINELTKRLRAIEKENEELKTKIAPVVEAVAKPKVPAAPTPRPAPEPFAEPEPKLEQFADQPDPYLAFSRALARYDRRKEAHDEAVAAHKSDLAKVGEHADWTFQQIAESHGKRLDAFKSVTPDFADVVSKNDQPTTPAMNAAIMLDPNGASYIYGLAKNPELYDELFLATHGREVTEHLVAVVQRRLRARLQTADTGSVVTRPVIAPAPRLPNPVKTVPQAPVSDGRPKETDSLEAHQKYHYPDGPRGRFRP